MGAKVLCVGDLHFQVRNLKEARLLTPQLVQLVVAEQPDVVVLLGDILHEFARLHAEVLAQAVELISALAAHTSRVVCLVGNHDYWTQSCFLSDQHWMRCLTGLPNVIVADKVVDLRIGPTLMLFSPWVPDGRLVEALRSRLPDVDWRQADAVFAHQTVDGGQMGHIVADGVELWERAYPLLVSGHLHRKQRPQPNVLYPGSAMQHSFAEAGETKSVLMLQFAEHKAPPAEREFHFTGLAPKLLLATSRAGLARIDPAQWTPDQQVKIQFSGNIADFKAAKLTQAYKRLVGMGNVQLVFKPSAQDLKAQKAAAGQNVQRASERPRSFLNLLAERAAALDNGHALMRRYFESQ